VTNRYGWYIEDLTVTVQAIATNMWSPQILGLNQAMFYTLAGASIVLATLMLSLVIVATRRKRKKDQRIVALRRERSQSLSSLSFFL
jgi:hypothetical protein